MQKKTLAIILIALLFLPLFIYVQASYIRGLLPPSEAALKMPHQFEEAFNEQMAPYGMSIDLDSAHYGYGDWYASKVVPVQCTDGSEITCRILTTSTKRKSLIILVEFEQPYHGEIPANLQPLFEMLLRVFETPLYLDKNADYFDGTYADILAKYQAFASSDEARAVINVSSNRKQTESIILERVLPESKEQGTLLLRLNILTSRRREW